MRKPVFECGRRHTAAKKCHIYFPFTHPAGLILPAPGTGASQVNFPMVVHGDIRHHCYPSVTPTVYGYSLRSGCGCYTKYSPVGGRTSPAEPRSPVNHDTLVHPVPEKVCDTLGCLFFRCQRVQNACLGKRNSVLSVCRS